MPALQEQLLWVFFSFSMLAIMRSAPKIIKLSALFGLLYICYSWSCEYLRNMHIYLMAVWNAGQLPQLSETCKNVVNIHIPERRYSWYDQYLHCAGELWGIGAWRTYRDYTSPHYLTLYGLIFLFIYCVIKQGESMLNNFNNSHPPSVDQPEFSDGLPPLPSSYHMYSHSYIANLKATTSSRIAGLTAELEVSKKREKEARAGFLIYGVLRKAVHRKQVSKLKDELKAEKGKIWALKSPPSFSRISPAASLLKLPVQDATLVTNLQAELDAAKQEIEGLKIAGPSAKAFRKLTVKFAASTKCNTKEDAQNTAHLKDLYAARREATESRAVAEAAQTTICQLHEQISSLKNAVQELDATNQEQNCRISELAAAATEYNSPYVKEVARLSVHYQYEIRKFNDKISRFLEENRGLNKQNLEYLSEGRTLQHALESIRTDLDTVTQCRDARQQDLDVVRSDLSKAQAVSHQHEKTIQILESRVESLKEEINCANEARKEALEALEKVEKAHTASKERVKCLTKNVDMRDIRQIKMLNQSLENELEESRRALEAAQETSRLAQERQQQLEAELEDQATLADLKLNEKDMAIDDLRSQADIENMALFDKRVARLDPAVQKAELDMARLEGELGRMRDDVSDLKGQLEKKTKEAKDEQSAANVKVIEYIERCREANVHLTMKSKELGEMKRIVEEQNAVLSRLAGTDYLFED